MASLVNRANGFNFTSVSHVDLWSLGGLSFGDFFDYGLKKTRTNRAINHEEITSVNVPESSLAVVDTRLVSALQIQHPKWVPTATHLQSAIKLPNVIETQHSSEFSIAKQLSMLDMNGWSSDEQDLAIMGVFIKYLESTGRRFVSDNHGLDEVHHQQRAQEPHVPHVSLPAHNAVMLYTPLQPICTVWIHDMRDSDDAGQVSSEPVGTMIRLPSATTLLAFMYFWILQQQLLGTNQCFKKVRMQNSLLAAQNQQLVNDIQAVRNELQQVKAACLEQRRNLKATKDRTGQTLAELAEQTSTYTSMGIFVIVALFCMLESCSQQCRWAREELSMAHRNLNAAALEIQSAASSEHQAWTAVEQEQLHTQHFQQKLASSLEDVDCALAERDLARVECDTLNTTLGLALRSAQACAPDLQTKLAHVRGQLASGLPMYCRPCGGYECDEQAHVLARVHFVAERLHERILYAIRRGVQVHSLPVVFAPHALPRSADIAPYMRYQEPTFELLDDGVGA